MFRVFTTFGLILSASMAEGRQIPNKFPESGGKIVGGTEINIVEAPYQVSVRVDGSHLCGGSILSDRFVLTAAHCTTDDELTDDFEVRVGSSRKGTGGTLIEVESIYRHPAYHEDSHDYDFAILKLEEPIRFGKTKQPVRLHEQDASTSDGEMLTVTGWGDTKTATETDRKLRSTQVLKVNDNECRKIYRNRHKVTRNMICAGFKRGGKDSCQGDSGGPLVNANKTIVGVVSWGTGCALPNYPGVYARVAAVSNWIKNVIKGKH